MPKMIISLTDLESAGLLKDAINRLSFDENDPRNMLLLMAKDYANGTLPQKYKNFKPQGIPAIEIDISQDAALAGIRIWLNEA